MKFISLTNSDKLVIIDNDDYHRFVGSKWYLSPQGYAVTKSRDKSCLLHRLIINAPDDDYVDHKNGLKLDNRKQNLRLCDQSYNMANMKVHRDSTTGYKGVSFNKNEGKYKANICRKGQQYHLGTFVHMEEAISAYNVKAKELFGEYARINNV